MRQLRRFGLVILIAFSVSGLAQLAPEQRVTDLQHLASLYAKNYAPYEWKRDTQNFDLLNLQPWVDKVTAAKDDLEFYEILIDYVASLNDAHDAYTLPSSFTANLFFGADIYDGKVFTVAIIDQIRRSR